LLGRACAVSCADVFETMSRVCPAVLQSKHKSPDRDYSNTENPAEQRRLGTVATVRKMQQTVHGSTEAAAKAVDTADLDARLRELHTAGRAAVVRDGQEILDIISNATEEYCGKGESSFRSCRQIVVTSNTCQCACKKLINQSSLPCPATLEYAHGMSCKLLPTADA